jgi:hypothetical protein
MVLYYVCDHCGYTWNVPKNDPSGLVRAVADTTFHPKESGGNR